MLEFARDLAAGDFDAAHRLLSSSAQSSLPATELRRQYDLMLSVYDDKSPGPIEFVMSDSMLGWATRQPGDIGWAYVAIEGAGWSEAVAGVVADDGGQARIRMVEFGRP
jgi:hypothetical protein